MIRFARLSRETVLTVCAALGLLCLAGMLASALFGVSALVFRSGSMAPAIHTGALALSQTVPAADIRVGDVVSAVNAQGTRISHRVISIERLSGGTYAMTMKGDANDTADATAYVITAADRIFWHADGLGYLAEVAQRPGIVFIGGLAVGAAVVSSFLLGRPRAEAGVSSVSHPTAGPHSAVGSRSWLHRGAPLPAIVALLLVPSVVHPEPTSAAFVSSGAPVAAAFATVSSEQLRPVFQGCSASPGGVTVSWTDPSAAVPARGYTVNDAAAARDIPAGTGAYSWSAPLAADDVITITARHFTDWSASVSVQARVAGGSVTCSVA